MTASALRSLVLLAALATVSTSASAQSNRTCPALPADSGLIWEQQEQANFVVCKATDAQGRARLNLMLTSDEPELVLTRSLRAEKGMYSGEEFHWYKMDTGSPKATDDWRRISVVKLDKRSYAQIWFNATSAEEVAAMQQLTSVLRQGNASLAGNTR